MPPEQPPLASDQQGGTGVLNPPNKIAAGYSAALGNVISTWPAVPLENSPLTPPAGIRSITVMSRVDFVASKAQAAGVVLISPTGERFRIWESLQRVGIAVLTEMTGPTFVVPQGWKYELESAGGATWKIGVMT